ncbi:MAG TPA: trehalose-phosphatase [Myxococcales bacterium]|jgi:trehalose 6-phosphate phosphatase|nr:trehalose-phosphatase [Myxococcales bacterium]
MESVFTAGVLERIAASDVLVAFDFDGTLAPIVADPALAAMRAPTRRLLAQVARLYPCAVISGRPEEEVLRLLGGVTVWYVIGNRALQPPDEVERLSTMVSEWREVLFRSLGGLSGVSLEDKGVSLAIHYRRAAEQDSAVAAIREAARGLENARLIAGKDVINLLPRGGPDKGVALARVKAQLGCTAALYVGDDATDEAAFALPQMLGVRVSPAADSAASYCLRDQDEVDDLLDRLVSLRPRREHRQEAMWRPATRALS